MRCRYVLPAPGMDCMKPSASMGVSRALPYPFAFPLRARGRSIGTRAADVAPAALVG